MYVNTYFIYIYTKIWGSLVMFQASTVFSPMGASLGLGLGCRILWTQARNFHLHQPVRFLYLPKLCHVQTTRVHRKDVKFRVSV